MVLRNVYRVIDAKHHAFGQEPGRSTVLLKTTSKLGTRRRPIGLLAVLFAAGVLWNISVAHARKPADVFKRQIILSTKAFPSSFKNDKAFIRYMKKAHKKRIVYPDSNRLTIRFMAFFSKPIRTTEFTALVYDLTDRNRLVATVPVAPSQRETRILASAFDIERRDFPEEHKYRVMIAVGSTALAQAQFTIKESKKNRAERVKREKSLKRGRSVDFSR